MQRSWRRPPKCPVPWDMQEKEAGEHDRCPGGRDGLVAKEPSWNVQQRQEGVQGHGQEGGCLGHGLHEFTLILLAYHYFMWSCNNFPFAWGSLCRIMCKFCQQGRLIGVADIICVFIVSYIPTHTMIYLGTPICRWHIKSNPMFFQGFFPTCLPAS